MFVDNGRNLVFLSGIEWSCGKIFMSMSGFWHFVKLSVGPKFGEGEVWAVVGLLSVNQSMNYWVRLIRVNLWLYLNPQFVLLIYQKCVWFQFFLIVKIIVPVRVPLILWVNKLWLVIRYFRYNSNSVKMTCLTVFWWVGVPFLIICSLLHRAM